jgi:hypothetical protein
MENAKNELRRALRNHGKPKILCAVIEPADHYMETNVHKALKNRKLFLPQGYTRKELVDFFKALDFEYHSGYGLQELEGTVWCIVDNGESTRTTWFSRHEYDGSEWWVYNDVPAIPPECQLGNVFGWGPLYEDEAQEQEGQTIDQTWEDSPHLAQYLPFLPEAQNLQKRIEQYVEGWNDYGHFTTDYLAGFPLNVEEENGIWAMRFTEIELTTEDDQVVSLEHPYVEVMITYRKHEFKHDLFEVPSLEKMDVMHCAQLFKRLNDIMLETD